PSCGSVCNSSGSETPLWFTSCQRRSELKIASRLSMMPSPFPPFCGLSYSARARKPFFSCPAGGSGWGVKLPNNSAPLLITPSPLRSSASHASSAPAAVHESLSALPSPSRSKLTPPAASVSAKPFPATSMRMGEAEQTHSHQAPLHAEPKGHSPLSKHSTLLGGSGRSGRHRCCLQHTG